MEKPILHHPTALHVWTAEHCRTNLWQPWFGFSAVSVYGDVVEEAGALARGAGIADFAPLPLYDLKGAQVASHLDRVVTRSASAMAVGEVKEALICAASGHLISLCTLLRLEQTRFLVMAPSEVGVRLGEGLDAGLGDLPISVERSSLIPIALFGPRREERLLELGINLELDGEGFVTTLDHKGIPLIVADLPGVTGGSFVMVRPDDAGLQWKRFVGKGAGGELVCVGLEALERRRIDLGVPREGAEFRSALLALKPREKVLPDELGLGHLVEQDGRIFAGAHALANTKGTRVLVRLELDRVVSVPGNAVMEGAREVGRITSAYEAPELGITKAIALIDADAGKNLSVGFAGDPVSAFVITD